MIAAAAVILLGSRNAPGGAYGPLLDQAPALRDVLEWTVWHVAVFALALGIVALMAFPAAVARLLGRGATAAERSLGATAAALSAWVLVSVVALSASPYGLGFLHERSLFFLAPLVLACLAHWLGHGLPRREGRCGHVSRGRRRGDRRAARAVRRSEQRLRLPGAPARSRC